MLNLLLPALFPSWRFFALIAPAPRIDIAPQGETWQPFRARPARLGAGALAARLVWNPTRNEDLYLVSLSERLIATGSDHAACEIEALLCRYMERPFRYRVVFADAASEAIGFTSGLITP